MSLEVTQQNDASPIGVLLQSVALAFSSVGRMAMRLLEANPVDIDFAIHRNPNGQFDFYDSPSAWAINMAQDSAIVFLLSTLPDGNSKAYNWRGRIIAAGDPEAFITLNNSIELTLEQIINAFARGELFNVDFAPNDWDSFVPNMLRVDQANGVIEISLDSAVNYVATRRKFATLGAGSSVWE